MNKPSVVVLMSTYNGEKYIGQQIESIMLQRDVDITLQIRDDGSTDRTISIIKEYQQKNKNIVLFEGENKGVGKSFLELLSGAPDADYYAFSDQDDYWMEDKLIHAIRMISKLEQSGRKFFKGQVVIIENEDKNKEEKDVRNEQAKPVLYASNSLLVDKELTPIRLHYQKIDYCDFYECLSRNIMFGCTMVMNKRLQEECRTIPQPSDLVLSRKNHDAWVLYIAFVLGIVIYDNEAKMLYRQHDKNVVGGINPRGIDAIKSKFDRLLSKKNKNLRSKLAEELIGIFHDELDSDMYCHLKKVANANSFMGAIDLIKDRTLVRAFQENRFMLFIRCLLGWV